VTVSNSEHGVAIITFHMPPYTSSWGGSQRMFYLSEYLVREGVQVSVYCLKQDSSSTKRLESVNVCPISIPWFKSSSKQSAFLNSASIPPSNTSFYKRYLKNVASGILKSIFNDLSPNDLLRSLLYLRKLKKRLERDIQAKRIYNTVLVSAPPFYLLTIIPFIKKKYPKMVVIADYRDPWHVWHKGSIISRLLEKRSLFYSDYAIFTNKALAIETSRMFNVPNNKVKVVSNGYSECAWKEVVSKGGLHDFFTINYVGSLSISDEPSAYRDVTIFMESLSELVSQGMPIKVNFYGVLSSLNNKRVNEYREKLKGSIGFFAPVSPSDSLKLMLQSDMLLLLHTARDNSGRFLINGKFYDYIAAGRPIFYIGQPSDLHWHEIVKTGLGHVATNTKPVITKAIKSAFDSWCAGESDLSDIDKSPYSRESQYSEVAKLIKGL
jgi:glycosyltransferase involved in cell wall biosynthesis